MRYYSPAGLLQPALRRFSQSRIVKGESPMRPLPAQNHRPRALDILLLPDSAPASLSYFAFIIAVFLSLLPFFLSRGQCRSPTSFFRADAFTIHSLTALYVPSCGVRPFASLPSATSQCSLSTCQQPILSPVSRFN
jgi:hypothetical protein